MNTNDIIIRSEKKEEYREVENLVREAFWNVYRPGCSEHYVLHVLRDDPAFIKELDFVMEKDGKLLLDHSLEKAAEMGFGAVLFEGNIDFYGKSGFDYARRFGIRYHDLPEEADDSFFLCKELIPGYLDEVTGIYQTPQAYYVDDADVDEFDKEFSPKKKLKLPGQLFE